MLIFAYGSNMNINRLKGRVPSAVKITNAILKGYRLSFNKISRKDGSSKANIMVSKPTDFVWGVVFEITPEEKGQLDREEGLGYGYVEQTVLIVGEDGREYIALAYIAVEEQYLNDKLKPYDWYYEFVNTGAIQNNLPPDYIDKIALFPFTVDPDESRRKENYAILNNHQI